MTWQFEAGAKSRFARLALGAALLMVPTLGGCGGGASTSTTTPAGGATTPASTSGDKVMPDVSGATVKVGLLHSLSGTMAISETSVKDAEMMAIDEINAKGGVMGKKIVPIAEDGASDWPTFKTKAEKLLTQDKVATVFGCWTSVSRKTVLPTFEKYNGLLWYPVQYEGMETSPNIFYTGATTNQQITPAVTWLIKTKGLKKFFLLGSDYVFPRTANAEIKAQLKAEGATLVGEEYTPLGHRDYATLVDKIKAAKPDVVFNSLNGDSNVEFFKQMKAVGLNRQRYADDVGFHRRAGNPRDWPGESGRALGGLELFSVDRHAAKQEVRRRFQEGVSANSGHRRPDGSRLFRRLSVEGSGRKSQVVRRGQSARRRRRPDFRGARRPGENRRQNPAHLENRAHRRGAARRPVQGSLEQRRAQSSPTRISTAIRGRRA